MTTWTIIGFYPEYDELYYDDYDATDAMAAANHATAKGIAVVAVIENCPRPADIGSEVYYGEVQK
jgi:hypothetical protein